MKKWFFVYESFYASVSRDGFSIHLKCAPKTVADRTHRKQNERLDAYVGIRGIEALFDELCPFGRMASAQVLLGPTPFCRKDTLLLTIRTTHKPATDLWIPAAQAARPCAMVASSLLSGVLSLWFNYA